MKAEWIKSQTSEMDGLWRHGVFQKVLRSNLTPQDRVFASYFHYKIKRKGGGFDKFKVRLVVQGQHMLREGEDCAEKVKKVLVIAMTLSALYMLLADSAPF